MVNVNVKLALEGLLEEYEAAWCGPGEILKFSAARDNKIVKSWRCTLSASPIFK